jgi:hypothetical protein
MHDVAHAALVTVTASPLTVVPWMLQYEGGKLDMPDCHRVAEVSVTSHGDCTASIQQGVFSICVATVQQSSMAGC